VSVAGPRRAWEEGREQRPYRCRRCGTIQDDWYLPEGWLQVRTRDTQADPDGHTYVIAGLFCTARCLAGEAAGWAAAVQQAEAEAEAGGSG
jgi:endogenous inhibitor of DNA gyrase (YacG/DUF329 family)